MCLPTWQDLSGVLCSKIWMRCCPWCPQIGGCDHYFMSLSLSPASPSPHLHSQSEASVWVTWSPLTNQRPAGTPHSNGKECGMWTWVEWNAATSHKPDTSVGWGPHEHQLDRDLQTHTNFPPVHRHICEFARQLILLCTVWLAPQTGTEKFIEWKLFARSYLAPCDWSYQCQSS